MFRFVFAKTHPKPRAAGRRGLNCAAGTPVRPQKGFMDRVNFQLVRQLPEDGHRSVRYVDVYVEYKIKKNGSKEPFVRTLDLRQSWPAVLLGYLR